jgi:hypothetical protein
MEELLPKLSESIKNVVEITENEKEFLIELKIIKKNYIPGDLGSPSEIKEMLQIFGGVSHEIPIDIEVNENFKIISLSMKNRGDFDKIRTSLKTIWQRAAELLQKAFDAEPGKTEEFRALGDFDEDY